MLTKGIWSRNGSDNFGDRTMVFVVGLFLSFAIGWLTFGSFISWGWTLSWTLLGVTFVVALLGGWIFTASDTPMISFIGVSIMSISLGLMMGPVLASKSLGVIQKALFLTATNTVAMTFVGIMYPKALQGAGGFLLTALTLLIVGNVARIFLPLFGFSDTLGILDWAGVAIFSGYIWYDWGRAMTLPHTLDNAIDASGALILDIANLLLNWLGIVDND